MKTKMKKLFSVALALVMALCLFTACGNNNVEETKEIEFIKITLPEEAIEVKVGEVINLEDYTTFWTDVPDLSKEELDVAIDALGLVWTVADETIATVDEEGVLTAISEGETAISVVSADEEFYAEGKVSVLPAEETSEDGEAVEHEASPKVDSDTDKNTENNKETDKTPVSSTENVNDVVVTPVATPTPVSTPEPAPVVTPAPTPEAPKCGAVGHTVDGTCSVCGSSYTTPKCGAVGHTADGTCSVCGSTYTTPKCGAVGHSADGTCSVCGSTYTTPNCGAVGHSADGTCSVCGSTYTTPKCGAVGHSADGTCSVCGSTYTTPRCPTCGATDHTSHPVPTCPVCGSADHTDHPALDNNQVIPTVPQPGYGTGDNQIIGK